MIAEGLRQSIIDVEPITCPIGDGRGKAVSTHPILVRLGRKPLPCYRSIWKKAGRNAVCGEETMALFRVEQSA